MDVTNVSYTLSSGFAIERYTTKARVSLYSGVNQADIDDQVIQDGEDWVEGQLRVKGIDPALVNAADSNLRQAATARCCWVLGQVGGGKTYKIHSTPSTSATLGEISESYQGTQVTGNEKPTSDWYVEAQRAIQAFIDNATDSTKQTTRRYRAVAASTTQTVPSDRYYTTGYESTKKERVF